MDVGLDGALGPAGRLGDLGVRQAVDVAQDDGRPLGRAQAGQQARPGLAVVGRVSGSSAGSAPGSKASSVVGTRRTRARLRPAFRRIVVSQPRRRSSRIRAGG